MAAQDITKTTNIKALVTCMILAILMVICRTGARIYAGKRPAAEDFICWFGLSCFITMCSLYLTVLNPLYTSQAVGAGLIPPPADLLDQVRFLMGRFFAIQLLFWLTLWSVKFSLLWMFRRLFDGLPQYRRAWIAIVIFTALALVGCEVSQLQSCDGGVKAYFTPGACQGPGDAKRQSASLYYSLTVDVLTDLLIMAIPIRLLWNLQITGLEKLSIGVAFIFGFITIVAAIVRAVSLGSAAASDSHVIPISWLVLWAAIEGLIAIVVNCLPTFAIFFRGRVVAHRTNYGYNSNQGTNGYAKESSISHIHSTHRARAESIPLEDVEEENRADSGMRRYRERADAAAGEHRTVVTASGKNFGRKDPDSSSQESIIGMTEEHPRDFPTKDGVYVMRTVSVS